MAAVAEIGAAVSPILVAAVLLLGHEYLRVHGLTGPSVEQITAATGVSRSRAYEVRHELRQMLPALLHPVGRPPSKPASVNSDVALELCHSAMAFIMAHPGCISEGPERHYYSDAFRRYVVELREQHPEVKLERFAEAILVPLGTLKEWLGAGSGSEGSAPGINDGEGDPKGIVQPSAEVKVVLSSWETWEGTFQDFCKHLREEERVAFGPSLIANILFVHGKRRPRRRAGRSSDERALRSSFETFFGGAQWVGDGSPIAVTINAERFVFNLELMVDAYSGGFVGMSIRDEEDGASVTEALDDGVATTGEAPLAMLLDNRPSNHTSEVRAAFGDVTIPIRATTQRPQNKGHVEGGFGLFQQTVPPLEVRGRPLRELAGQVLKLVAQTWARTLNHRPRTDRGGRSRIELYNDPITAEQIDAARAALALLDEAFQRLALLDPDAHLRAAIARYPLDVIVDGLAIFEGKRRVGTLPPGVDARYLLGIVRNLGDEREGIAIAAELLRARLQARDHMLAPLVEAHDAARAELTDTLRRVLRFVDLALTADRRIDRLFWLHAVADEINSHAKSDATPLVDAVARRVHATHRVNYRERQEAMLAIIAQVVPLT